jgi:uncharacterized membrane protein
MTKTIDFLTNKIIGPVINQTGYTLFNTLVIGFSVLFFYFLAYRFLKKIIKIDKHFLITTIYFTVIGAFLRILEEDYVIFGGVIKRSINPLKFGFYFYTPGLLILLVVIYVMCFSISYLIYKERYYVLLKKIALFLITIISFIILFNIINWQIFFISIIMIFLFYFLLVKNSYKLIKKQYFENKLLILSQTIDLFATLLGVYFFKGYLYEQHFLSRALIGISPFLYFFLKVLITFGFIYILDYCYFPKTEKDLKRRYIKQIIIILGFLTGIRNLLTLWLLI